MNDDLTPMYLLEHLRDEADATLSRAAGNVEKAFDIYREALETCETVLAMIERAKS